MDQMQRQRTHLKRLCGCGCADIVVVLEVKCGTANDDSSYTASPPPPPTLMLLLGAVDFGPRHVLAMRVVLRCCCW